MLQPKKTKFRKNQKGRTTKLNRRSAKLKFGRYGLKVLEPVRLSRKQLEASRRAIVRRVKKLGKIWVRVFPDLAVSAKPREVRMGKGKGNVSYWASRVSPGTIIFELDSTVIRGSSPKLMPEEARAALHAAATKLPCRTKLIDNR
jgi:large subunit ribosomal protein L16